MDVKMTRYEGDSVRHVNGIWGASTFKVVDEYWIGTEAWSLMIWWELCCVIAKEVKWERCWLDSFIMILVYWYPVTLGNSAETLRRVVDRRNCQNDFFRFLIFWNVIPWWIFPHPWIISGAKPFEKNDWSWGNVVVQRLCSGEFWQFRFTSRKELIGQIGKVICSLFGLIFCFCPSFHSRLFRCVLASL